MALEYDSSYVTSKAYADAKSLFDSKSRTYTGDLPRLIPYWLATIVDKSTSLFNSNNNKEARKQMLDSGFYAIMIYNALGTVGTVDVNYCFSFGVGTGAGEQILADYALSSDLPIVIHEVPNRYTFVASPSLTLPERFHPCKQADGTHIGEYTCPTNFTSDSKYRWRDGDTPRDYVPFLDGASRVDEWIFTASSPPSSTYFYADSTTFSSVTTIRIHDECVGYSASSPPPLSSYSSQTLRITETSDFSQYAIYTIDSATNMGTYYEFAVTHRASSGDLTAGDTYSICRTTLDSTNASLVPYFPDDNSEIIYDATSWTWTNTDSLPGTVDSTRYKIGLCDTYGIKDKIAGTMFEDERKYPPNVYFNYYVHHNGLEWMRLQTLMDEDNRYNLSSWDLSEEEWIDGGYSKAMEQTAQATYDNAQTLGLNITSEYYNLYDAWTAHPYYISQYTCPLMIIWDRVKAVYSFYVTYYGTCEDTLTGHGQKIARYASNGLHVFDAWLDAGGTLTSTGLTVAEGVGCAKLLMGLGTFRFGLIDNASRTNHHWWSISAGYDDMQPYADFIKYGENFIPPKGMMKDNSVDTVFYGSDYYGNELPYNIWISCRTYNNQALYVGFVSDEDTNEYSYTILSPFGTPETIECSPFGRVTVIS